MTATDSSEVDEKVVPLFTGDSRYEKSRNAESATDVISGRFQASGSGAVHEVHNSESFRYRKPGIYGAQMTDISEKIEKIETELGEVKIGITRIESKLEERPTSGDVNSVAWKVLSVIAALLAIMTSILIYFMPSSP